MKAGKIKSLIFVIFGCFYAFFAYSATSLFSDYGQIQNVQNYSTNPFWTPNSPYNQKMPQPVYVQGTNISGEECVKVIQSAVSMQCMARDNCKNTSLSDIRPAVIVQLSNLPNKAYSTACIGYLDTVYESYVSQYGNNAPTGRIGFPSGTVPNPALNNNNAPVIQNPYEIKTPQWQQEINERSNELQKLQQQNGAGNIGLSATAFPTTYADLSFTERMANDAAGYEPFKDKSAYKTIKAQNVDEWCQGHSSAPECKDWAEAQRAASGSASTQNKDKKTLNAELQKAVSVIVNALNPKDEQQKTFLTALVTQYVTKWDKGESVVLDDKFVYDFLSDEDRLTRYKAGLVSLTGSAFNEDLKINLDWDEILRYISSVLDTTNRMRGALVCENNRSLQMGIDVAMWAATIYSLGSMATVQAGVKVGASAGLKALAKGAAKIGAQAAATSLSTTGRTLLKEGTGLLIGKAVEKFSLELAGKLLTTGVKTIGKNLLTKRSALLAAGAIAYQTKGKQSLADSMEPKGGFNKRAAGFLYSLVDSEPSTAMVNCQDLDKGEGCYHICGSGRAPNDDLNTKVFKPVMGKMYCVDKDDYTLYEIDTKKPLMMNDNQYKQIVDKIHSSIVDKGHCDWNEDDIDMYVGSYMYDPDTLEPSSELIVEDVIRLDD